MQLVDTIVLITGAAGGIGRAIIAQHPIGRMGKPEEIGGGVVYLCSTAASFVTGCEFVIDGGFTSV